jgi:hypothetical protein
MKSQIAIAAIAATLAVVFSAGGDGGRRSADRLIDLRLLLRLVG